MDPTRSSAPLAAAPAIEAGPAAELVRALFIDQYGRMVRLAQYLSGEPDRGEEIAQEAFAGLVRRAGELADPERAGAYLRRVVANLARSSARRRRTLVRRAARTGRPEGRPGDADNVIEDRRVVLVALARLPRRQRECLVLRYYLDLSEADIAESLGISPGAVKTHSSRGMAAMAQILGERP